MDTGMERSKSEKNNAGNGVPARSLSPPLGVCVQGLENLGHPNLLGARDRAAWRDPGRRSGRIGPFFLKEGKEGSGLGDGKTKEGSGTGSGAAAQSRRDTSARLLAGPGNPRAGPSR